MKIDDKLLNKMYTLVRHDKRTLLEIQSLEKNPENVDLWITIGKKMFNSKKYETSLECYEWGLRIKS